MPTEESGPWEALRRLPMGQRIEITDGKGREWAGCVLPSHDFSGDRVLTIKLDSGYNVGIVVGPDVKYRLVGDPPRAVGSDGAFQRAASPETGGVALLTTGGTIASRVDYTTGGVRPVSEPGEILAFYPELARSGPVRIVRVFDKMSEDIGPDDWLVLAKHVVEAFDAGAQGVVIAHGTDTLGFSAAALSFLLEGLPGPVVLVGAQRSPDRPSSDGPSNLAAASAVARDRRIGEVVVVMHEGLSDTRFAIHRGSRVRKMHSSRRDAFETRNGPPIGSIEGDRVTLSPEVRPPGLGPARVDGPIDRRGGLLWAFPGISEEQARRFAHGLRGVVLAGTGLGHVPHTLLPWIRSATAEGVVVAMTTQCLEGNTDPYVYATGRDILQAGAVYLGDMLPETAYTKLLWALGHETTPDGVRTRLLRDRAGEFTPRHRPDGAA